LVVVLFFGNEVRAVAAPLPVGTWQVHANPNRHGELVITAVMEDGAVVGTLYGKPLKGTWNGTKLSVTYHDASTVCYEGWLVEEKKGDRVRYTLTGSWKFWTAYPVHDENGVLQSWFTAGGWYAQLDQHVPAK
jgi:hypothetical protein